VGLQILLVDVLDRFPVQLKVPGDIDDGHDLTQLMDLGGQPPGYSQIGVKDLQLLDADSLAMGTEQFTVLATQPDLSAGQVQVSYRTLSPAMNSWCFVPTQMTDGLEPVVGSYIDNSFYPSGVHRLVDNFDSTKGEIRCYRDTGHRRPPSGIWFFLADQPISSEIPDVHSA
jgi:hypothetical protein